ncbi:MAG: hypothetical protein HY538_08685 [Deltaproteobacteria bacterium]|nr:hypothetical protein [Deltaproteobacteria bacterium]
MNSKTETIRWRHWAVYLPIYLLHRFIHLLPRSVWSALAKGIGTLCYWLIFSRRKLALKNLDHVYGATKTEKEKRAIAKASFQNFSNSLFEILWARHINAQNYERFIERDPESWRRISEARKKGGVIILLGHIGNAELLAVGAGYQGLPIHYVARSLKNPLLDRLIDGLRCSGSVGVVYAKGALPRLKEILLHNEMIAILLDQRSQPLRGGIIVPFLGQPALTNRHLAELALDTGSSIMHFYPQPLGNTRWRAIYEAPIQYTPTGDREKDVYALTQKCNEALDATIRKYPEMWFWVHDRWRM